MDERVLIDTCIWATVFSKPRSVVNRAVEQLIKQGRVVVIGPVLTEVLYGFRRSDQADWASSRLKSLGWMEVEQSDWREAAAIGRKLAADGYRLPIADLVIAAMARRHDLMGYTNDPHFDLFTDLRRYSP